MPRGKLSDRFCRANLLSRPGSSSYLLGAVFFSRTMGRLSYSFFFARAIVTRDCFTRNAPTDIRPRVIGQTEETRRIELAHKQFDTRNHVCDRGMCFPSIHSERFSIYDCLNVIDLTAASAWIHPVATR